ncbi:Rax2 family protein [Burkholderia sp. NRF60-BP8]|nr:Rax2 family protein [Burkholderia sp. NRF60-BP8]
MQTFVKIVLLALGSLFVVGIIYEVIDRIRGAMKNIENDEHHRH